MNVFEGLEEPFLQCSIFTTQIDRGGPTVNIQYIIMMIIMLVVVIMMLVVIILMVVVMVLVVIMLLRWL